VCGLCGVSEGKGIFFFNKLLRGTIYVSPGNLGWIGSEIDYVEYLMQDLNVLACQELLCSTLLLSR
jgi:hypothetical protein